MQHLLHVEERRLTRQGCNVHSTFWWPQQQTSGPLSNGDVFHMAVAQYDQFVAAVATRTLRENGSCQEVSKRRCRCETWVSLVCKRLLCLRNGALLPGAAW